MGSAYPLTEQETEACMVKESLGGGAKKITLFLLAESLQGPSAAHSKAELVKHCGFVFVMCAIKGDVSVTFQSQL